MSPCSTGIAWRAMGKLTRPLRHDWMFIQPERIHRCVNMFEALIISESFGFYGQKGIGTWTLGPNLSRFS